MSILIDFEEALKKKYSCEVEFLHASEMQNIIDRCRFTYYDIREVCKNKYLLASRDYFSKTSSGFCNTVDTMQYIIEIDNNKFRYVFCGCERFKPGVLVTSYIYAFPAYLEQSYYINLFKLEKLKAFL
jgi:hypothetical protein